MLTIKRLLISGLFLGSLVSYVYAQICPTPVTTCTPACDSTCDYYILTETNVTEQCNVIPSNFPNVGSTCENKYYINPPVTRLPFDVTHSYKTFVKYTLTGPSCLPASAPVILSTPVTCNSITVNWQAVSGATYYKVSLSTGVSTQVVGTSYTFTGLTYNQQYIVNLQACNNNGCTPQSSRNVTTSNDIACYPTPGNPALNLSSTDTTISASWSAVAGANTYYIGIGNTNNSTSATAYTFSGLTQNTNYNVFLKACVVVGGNSKCSNTVARSIKTLEENDPTLWDVSVKFTTADYNSFYPFRSSAGGLGIVYFARLNKEDIFYSEWVGGACCSSTGYYWNLYEQQQARRAKAWYVERKRISDTQYRILIRGYSRADCGLGGRPYVVGELNVNMAKGWSISRLAQSGYSTDNQGGNKPTGVTYTASKVSFAAGQECGGCCVCVDGGWLNIEVIVTK